MRLGFAVKVLGAGGLPSHDTRRHQSDPSLGVSLEHLDAILAYLDDTEIRFYRMATGLAPYASHPELTRFRDQPQRFAEQLAAVGARARAPACARRSAKRCGWSRKRGMSGWLAYGASAVAIR